MKRTIFIAAIASLVPTFCLSLDARAQIMTPSQIYTAPYGTMPNINSYYCYGCDQGSSDSQYFQGNDDYSSYGASDQESQFYPEAGEQQLEPEAVIQQLDYVFQEFSNAMEQLNSAMQPDN
jgi:hypothetical protein